MTKQEFLDRFRKLCQEYAKDNKDFESFHESECINLYRSDVRRKGVQFSVFVRRYEIDLKRDKIITPTTIRGC